MIDFVRIPIHAEAAAAHLPMVVRIAAALQGRIVTRKIFSVNPKVRVLAQLSAIPHSRKEMFLRARATAEQKALGVLRAFCNYVNDAVDGIGAPEGSARPANDFNAIDVIQQRV